MLRNIIVLEDGRELAAGAPGAAIQSLRLLQTVCDGKEPEPGGVCAAMLEVSVMDAGGFAITAGEKMTLYKADEAGNRFPMGVFTAEKPVRTSADTFTVTAYDAVTSLDRDLTAWLQSLSGWPCSLWELAKLVCDQCGVGLQDAQLPGGSFPVQAFDPGPITGRQLIRWIAQALGRFCRANEEGKLEFSWFQPVSELSIGPEELPELLAVLQGENLVVTGSGLTAGMVGDNLILTGPNLLAATRQKKLSLAQGGDSTVWYRRGSLQQSDYKVAPVERVQLRAGTQDIGTIWPPEEGSKNTYILTANPVLQALSEENRLDVAKNLYELLRNVTFAPCSVQIPVQPGLRVGSIIPLWNGEGQALSLYVMTREQTGQTDKLSCTGSASRNSTTAVNHAQRQLAGKVLELQMDVQGLRAENRQEQEKSAALELTVEGITAQVRQQQVRSEDMGQQLSTLQQTAQQLSLELQTVQQEGVQTVTTTTGYRFDADGLHIRKTGEQMENQLDHTGMYVRRSGQVILQATGEGVEAVDVAVRNYLVIGDHARLEDYATSTDPNRTACFYIT